MAGLAGARSHDLSGISSNVALTSGVGAVNKVRKVSRATDQPFPWPRHRVVEPHLSPHRGRVGAGWPPEGWVSCS
jgi:hypothetical protein